MPGWLFNPVLAGKSKVVDERINLALGGECGNRDAITAEVERHQQILLFRHVPFMTLINTVNGTLVAVVMWTQVPTWRVATWLALIIASSVILLLRVLPLRSKPPPPKERRGWMPDEAELWSAFMGLLWGSIIVIFFTGNSVFHQMFLAVVIGGMAGGTTSLLQSMPRICAAFIVPALVPLAVVFILQGTDAHLAIAVMSVLYFVGLLNSSRRSYHRLAAHVESAIELERAKSDLIDAIESINDAFATYEGDGRVKLTNRRFRTWFGDRRALTEIPGIGGLYQMPGGAWIRGSVRPTSRGYVSVHTDVSELKNRESELLEAKRQAEEASAAKSEFLANMSHELRTPLNAIMGFSQLMRRGMFGSLGSKRYQQYTEDIHDSAAHLLAIINDILNLSKIESASYALTYEDVNITELIDWVVGVCTHQKDKAASVKICVQISPDFGSIRADARALKQVLLNLVNNAVKFTPSTGRIDVTAYINERKQPCISVADTGIGIPKHKLKAVRRPFRQVEGAFQRRFQGTGLGLSISEALVRLHGGQLRMESELGQGTRVTVILPADLHILNRGSVRVG